METLSTLLLVILPVFLDLGGTAIAWSSENVNTTMCSWSQLRGQDDEHAALGNTAGLLYYFSFSKSFNTKTVNLGSQSMTKAGGAANNIAPTYIDGTMFANDYEFCLYGGLFRLTDSIEPPDAYSVLGYERYQYGPYRASWAQGFISETLPTGNLTRYITNGAGVSIPNENMGYYFSGMRGENWGIIESDDVSADIVANSLISINMTVMRDATWSNSTLPSYVPGRANAEIVWIPISESGILIVIGGVINPEAIYPGGLNDSQISQSRNTSPGFMLNLPVYDIASQKWYFQSTSGTAPDQLTQFCSVVATANDNSSFNIYIYGGYNGYNTEDIPSDDVYILSIPSFHWVKAYSGNGTHGRRGHKCALVYPNQMFVVGGQYMDPTTCVEGILQVFNLNSLEFQDTYDPTIWDNYEVPDVVTNIIGGNANGSATTKAPLTSWDDSSLSALFETKYTKTMTTWYPYTATSSSSASPTISIVYNTNGLPKWVAPVIGAVLGIIFVTTLIILVLLWRRRLRHRQSDTSTHAPEGPRNRILTWISGTSPLPKEDATLASTEGGEEQEVLESGGRQIHEMQALSLPLELPTTYNASRTSIHQLTPSRASQITSVSRNFSIMSASPLPLFSTEGGSPPHPPQQQHGGHSLSPPDSGDLPSPIPSPESQPSPRPQPSGGGGGGGGGPLSSHSLPRCPVSSSGCSDAFVLFPLDGSAAAYYNDEPSPPAS
ncbi:MAG: hypothetical protein M1834_003302 [Cirrosporium novae-zelandiae]|nr:MAG: hypothetical protein M1834_003302 [Cirrosporium novae-zelandiae]